MKGKQTAEWDKIFTRGKELFLISYGNPRSGTTFMQYVLNQGRGYYYNKLKEQHPLHPCNSPDGLIKLQSALTGMEQEVIFIRTYRHPFKIIESFRFARIWEKEKFGDKVGIGVGGLSSWSDDFIIERMLNEHRNTNAQRKECQIYDMKYEEIEKLKNVHIRSICSFIDNDHSNYIIFQDRFNRFGKASVREGRLHHDNYKDALLTDAEKDKFYNQLKEIFEECNYEKV